MPLESYVVRIYRRAPDGGLVGLVEVPGVEGGRAFRSVEEFWEILSVVNGPPRTADAAASSKQK